MQENTEKPLITNSFGFDSTYFDSFWNAQIFVLDGKIISFGSLVLGVLFLIIGILFSKLVSKIFSNSVTKKFKANKNANHVIESVSFYILIFLSTLFALKVAHIPLTVFTVLGGAFAIGVGFGSQNLISNFISGLIMMIENPIRVGDYVEVDGIFGEVDHIGTRSTSILSYGNKHIIVPNSFFLEKNLINWTHKNKTVRGSVKVGVAYGTDTKAIEKLLLQAAKEDLDTLNQRPPVVFFTDFSDNSLNFQLDFSLTQNDLDSRRTTESNIRHKIDHLFRENDIVISFPQRDVHLDQRKPLEIKISNSIDKQN